MTKINKSINKNLDITSSQDSKQRPLWQEVVVKTEEVSRNTSRYQISQESASELRIKIAVCLQTNAGNIARAED